MNRLILCIAFLASALSMPELNAQVVNDTTKNIDLSEEMRKKDPEKYYAERRKQNRIRQLSEEKVKIVESEKYLLKLEVERIDSLQVSGQLSSELAKDQKMEAARIAALNIDNKTAIIDNQLALVQRDNTYNFQYAKGSTIELGLGNAYDDKGSFLLGLGYTNESPKILQDKRTYSDVVIAIGFNNTIREGESFWDSPYKFGTGSYLELGYTLRTRMFKDNNSVRLVYGLSMQFQRFESDDNKYFDVQNGQTVLTDFGARLKKSNMRFDNLVLPFFFEFGPSKKVESQNRFRYDTTGKFKLGIGGFAGFNLGTLQKLRFNQDGETVVETSKRDYNASKFVYGLNTYAGFGALAIFVKYDLNPVFDDGLPDQHNIAAGVRFDF